MNFSLHALYREMKQLLFFHISSLECVGQDGSWQPEVDSPLAMVSIPASLLESGKEGAVGFSPLPSIPYGTFPVPCGPNRGTWDSSKL